jgi:hypothetical protein
MDLWAVQHVEITVVTDHMAVELLDLFTLAKYSKGASRYIITLSERPPGGCSNPFQPGKVDRAEFHLRRLAKTDASK